MSTKILVKLSKMKILMLLMISFFELPAIINAKENESSDTEMVSTIT